MPTRSSHPTAPGTSTPPGRIEAAFAELDANPRFAWTRRRRNRRLLVLAQAMLLLASLVLFAFEQLLPALVVFLTFFPLMSLVNLSIHGILDIPAARLDPVMQGLRTEAKATAHSILLWLLIALASVVLVLGALSVDDAGRVDVSLFPVVGVGFGAVFTAGSLMPRWLLAWQLPEPDEQDLPSA